MIVPNAIQYPSICHCLNSATIKIKSSSKSMDAKFKITIYCSLMACVYGPFFFIVKAIGENTATGSFAKVKTHFLAFSWYV